MGKAERAEVNRIFSDGGFKKGSPATRLEMGRVRLYQQVGILGDAPADQVESQGEVVRLVIGRTKRLLKDFVSANPPPTQK